MSADGSDSSSPFIAVSPGDQVVLGFFEDQVFEVDLFSETGDLLPGRPVSVRIVGSANNSNLYPLDLETDDDGHATVIFTAPSVESSLQIRFSSPAVPSDVLIPVTVDPSRFGFTLDVDYSGERDIVEARAAVYEDAACDGVGQGGDDEAAGEEVSDEAVEAVPGTFEFDGMLSDVSYAAVITGYDADGYALARVCRDGILADGSTVAVSLDDLALDPAGLYSIATELTDASPLYPVLAQLVDSTDPFSSDVAAAILSSIRAQISDATSAAAFDAVRDDDDLDLLLQQDLAARGVNVALLLSGVGQSAQADLDALELASWLELAATDGYGEVGFVHTIGGFSFAAASEYSPSLGGEGYGMAHWSETEPDRLIIGEHLLPLGLGGLLFHVLEDRLALATGVSGGAATVLEDQVDCAEVATLLVPHLSSVTDSLTVIAGCEAAMTSAADSLSAEAAVIDAEYGSLRLDGVVTAIPEGPELSISAMVDGEMNLSWQGTEILQTLDATATGSPASKGE